MNVLLRWHRNSSNRMGFLFAAMQVLNSCEKCKPEYKYIKMPVLRFFMRRELFFAAVIPASAPCFLKVVVERIF